MTTPPIYFLARDANGKVWRVDPAAQSKVDITGNTAALHIDRYFLDAFGYTSEIQDFSGAQDWIDSIPTVS